MSMYVTVAEFQNAPTGIDPMNIIPGGTTQQNNAELFNVLQRASAWVDQICKQRLEAQTLTETKEITMNNMGLIRVHPNCFPIISLQDSVQYSVSPAGPWIPLPLTYIQVLQRYFVVYNLNTQSISPVLAQQFPSFGYFSSYRVHNLQRIPLTIQYTYVNGYTNTTISGNASAGATTIALQSNLGVYAGLELTIYDGANTEQVFVQSINGNAITLISPLLFTHNSGIPISALPANVKQATILLASYLIKTRGALSLQMGETSLQGVSRYKDAADIDIAKELLTPFLRGLVS